MKELIISMRAIIFIILVIGYLLHVLRFSFQDMWIEGQNVVT